MKGLYIHIPFCMQKCRYCDFVSYTGCTEYIDSYIEAVRAEMEQYRGEKLDTVFIGGGTPTVLSAPQLERLVSSCFEIFDIVGEYEFTAEANPGTLDDDKIKTLLYNGVNRISVGVQSFNDDELRMIGRIHDAKTAYNTICRLNELGFLNINADIMTALPYQNMDKLRYTLETAVSLPVSHISAYSLIIEDGTPLKSDYDSGKIETPDDDSDREMYAFAKSFLEKNGFLRYEISNFAKDNAQCHHNIKYWECREYIGVGTAASSYVNGERFTNTVSLSEYINGERLKEEKEKLSMADKISEFMMLGLRMERGISIKEFEKRFGCDINSVYKKELTKFTKGGLLLKDGDFYRFSERGFDVSNSVLCEFMLNC